MLRLLISKSSWNQSSMSSRYPGLHPTRASWMGDVEIKARVATSLLYRDEMASVGSLQSDLSMAVSANNMAQLVDQLKLTQYAPWAESVRQKAELLEQIIGLSMILSTIENPPFALNEQIIARDLLLKVTDALVFSAQSVQGVPEELITDLIQSFSILIFS